MLCVISRTLPCSTPRKFCLNVNSNDISFHKFLAGYTEIMSNCKGSEALGRPRLLHAISTVFGCMSWPETRLFHNLVMVKLEQGRIKWDADFTILADKYIEQKVRQTLKSKSQGTGYSYMCLNIILKFEFFFLTEISECRKFLQQF